MYFGIRRWSSELRRFAYWTNTLEWVEDSRFATVTNSHEIAYSRALAASVEFSCPVDLVIWEAERVVVTLRPAVRLSSQ